ncbi:hypothetical protein BU14_0407s0020 [Porphyra umbilicalis]|uniref:Uncharacterized protein n=1 Tax=Porphyra umbilicalis TaxID=2786 RepID=A0A1X6NW73_PORUM|nr:hypothetical protein BU14_0407s0020 [Porphyra umbilicalis]|eukprot:OSX72756.1 hypothetical protein BU14_0407s0020 [Porphyra umbilicalis]
MASTLNADITATFSAYTAHTAAATAARGRLDPPSRRPPPPARRSPPPQTAAAAGWGGRACSSTARAWPPPCGRRPRRAPTRGGEARGRPPAPPPPQTAATDAIIGVEEYLLGVCGAVSEVRRAAVVRAGGGAFAFAAAAGAWTAAVWAGFTALNFRNDGLRRRYDGMKYDVVRVGEVVEDLRARGLLPPPPAGGGQQRGGGLTRVGGWGGGGGGSCGVWNPVRLRVPHRGVFVGGRGGRGRARR